MNKLFTVLLVFCSLFAHADVKLPPVISDHMMLQRDVAAPIWGSASPGVPVSVAIAGQTKTTTADAKGNWKVILAPLSAAEGLTENEKQQNVTVRRRGHDASGACGRI